MESDVRTNTQVYLKSLNYFEEVVHFIQHIDKLDILSAITAYGRFLYKLNVFDLNDHSIWSECQFHPRLGHVRWPGPAPTVVLVCE